MSLRYSVTSQGANAGMTRRSFAVGAAAVAMAAVAAPAFAEEAAEEATEPEFDATSGASQVVDPAKQLTQEQIHDLACDYLRGWPLKTDENGDVVYAYREMYALATSWEDHPCISQVEFTLIPETMHLIASCEKGTQKCVQLAHNPEAMLYWCHQIPEEEYVAYANDYFNSYGVQFKGHVEFMSLEDEGAAEKASLYLETLYGAEKWAATPDEKKEQSIAGLFEWNDWLEFVPDEVVVNSLNWRYNSEESSRPEWYDPEDISFGMSVRQEYYPEA